MLLVIKHKLQHLYQINRNDDNSALVLSKNLTFHKKMDKLSTFNLVLLMLSAPSHSQSPNHSKIYLQSLETKPETHFILWQSVENLFHFSLSFLGTKSCLKKKQRLETTIFFWDSESKNLFNALRLRLLRMLAMPRNHFDSGWQWLTTAAHIWKELIKKISRPHNV